MMVSRCLSLGFVVALYYLYPTSTASFVCGFSLQNHRLSKSRSTLCAATTSEVSCAAKEQEQQITQQILQGVQNEHDEEISIGFDAFGETSGKFASRHDWSDSDFNSYTVEVGTAGPDEFSLERGNEIFHTKNTLVSEIECQELIEETREAIRHGLNLEKAEQQQPSTGSSSPSDTSNARLGEARVSQLPSARTWLQQALHERFFPLLESRFAVAADTLTLHDALIIGYGSLNKQGATSQPVHRDTSILSLNVALSPSSDYKEGGTFFEGLTEKSSVLANEQGHVLCHAGGVSHAGRGIQSGERWVLVLFCIAKSHPQLARRCHASGMRLHQSKQFDLAIETFRAGLSVAPRDHLLHMSLGNVYMAQGREKDAQLCLKKAALYYPHCGRANLTLGRMFLSSRRPRAALRRFEAVLEWLQDRDLELNAWTPWRAMGWDARVYGAQATIMCTQYAMYKGMERFPVAPRLQRAQEWLEVALRAVPGDQNIQGMLAKADEMLELVEKNR